MSDSGLLSVCSTSLGTLYQDRRVGLAWSAVEVRGLPDLGLSFPKAFIQKSKV